MWAGWVRVLTPLSRAQHQILIRRLDTFPRELFEIL